MWDDVFLNALKQQVERNAPSLKLHYAHEVTSTNDWAWQYYDNASPVVEPQLFVAETQCVGRGTQQRQWVSPPGSGVYMSLLYPASSMWDDDAFTPHQNVVPLYTEMAALATWVALTRLYPSLMECLRIRNVNDLCIAGHKLGGILVESRMNPNGALRAVVTGVGINLLPDTRRCVEDGRNIPTSLAEHLSKDEADTLSNNQALGQYIGAYIHKVYSLFHQGQLPNAQRLLTVLRD